MSQMHQFSRWAAVVYVISISAAPASPAFADSAGAMPARADKVTQQSGRDIYANVCQACHMPNGTGAMGAGRYPSLVNNENLASAGYPIYIVLHGQNAMPPFGEMMSDQQIAAVVNYIRTNFGNDYKDGASAADVKDAR